LSEKGVQVLDRAFDILELLAAEKNGLSITEISQRLGLNKSTVHRIVTALVSRGFAEKQIGGLNYGIGLRFVEIVGIRLSNIELKAEARPFLQGLTQKTGQPVHLGILDGLDVVYIDKVDNISSLRIYSQIGRRISVHCSALGKILLSEYNEKELTTLLNQVDFAAYTKKTITGKKNLIKEILEAGENGYAVDDGEHEENIRCVAAPVFDYRRKIIAAISVSGESEIFVPEVDLEIRRGVIECAYSVSRRLGFKL